MMTMIDTQQTLGDVAATHPASTRVFLRHRLDFCCGGRQKLEEACRKAGLNPAHVIAEIVAEEAPSVPVRWDQRPLPELVEYIIFHYHDAHRSTLPALIDAAARVERVHGSKETCPHGLADQLAVLDRELRHHMAKEEQILFPAIVSRGPTSSMHMPVRVLMQEHEDHGENLQALRALCTDYRPPREACATWRALYGSLQKLESELMEHIHLENNILFPRALGS